MWISKASAKEMGSIFMEIMDRRPKRYLLESGEWVTALSEDDIAKETEYEYMVEYDSGSQEWITDVMDTAYSKIRVYGSEELAWNTECDYCKQVVGSCPECVCGVCGAATRQHRHVNFGCAAHPRT